MQIHLIFNLYYPTIFVYQNKSILNCTKLLTSAADGGTLFYTTLDERIKRYLDRFLKWGNTGWGKNMPTPEYRVRHKK